VAGWNDEDVPVQMRATEALVVEQVRERVEALRKEQVRIGPGLDRTSRRIEDLTRSQVRRSAGGKSSAHRVHCRSQERLPATSFP